MSEKYYVIASAKHRRKLDGNKAVSVCNDCRYFQEKENLLLNMLIAWTPFDLKFAATCTKCQRPLINKSKSKIVFDAGGDWVCNLYPIPSWCPLEDQAAEPRPEGMPDDWPETLEWHKKWSPERNIAWREGWGE